MKRILIAKPGGYDRLELHDFTLPPPSARELRVEVHAIGVNYADCVVRMGLYQSAKEYVGWPITPGFEFAGVVRAVGSDVIDVAVGERVFGLTRFGAYQTEVNVERELVRRVPVDWSLADAGAFPVAFLTAWYAVRELGHTRAGARLLVHSAAGGVGLAAVQLGKHLGAHVTGVVGGAHKVEAARNAGCDVVIDKSKEPLKTALGHGPEEGYDVVLDPNGQATLALSYAALRPTGRLVIYGFQSMLPKSRGRPNLLRLVVTYLRTPRFDPLRMTNENKSVMAFNLSYLFDRRERLTEALDELLAWGEAKRIHPLPLELHRFEDVAQAHRRLESGSTVGRLVLTTEHAR